MMGICESLLKVTLRLSGQLTTCFSPKEKFLGQDALLGGAYQGICVNILGCWELCRLMSGGYWLQQPWLFSNSSGISKIGAQVSVQRFILNQSIYYKRYNSLTFILSRIVKYGINRDWNVRRQLFLCICCCVVIGCCIQWWIDQNYFDRLIRDNIMRSLRYQQSPAIQSYNDLASQHFNRSKVSSSSKHNPEHELLKLPQLNIQRTSSNLNTSRNTKFLLQNLQEKLEELGSEVHNTRLQASETLNNIRFMRQKLVTSELAQVKEDLKKQVKGLQRFVNMTRMADEERYNNLRADCGELWNQTQELRQNLFDLRMHTDKLQQYMGYTKNNDHV